MSENSFLFGVMITIEYETKEQGIHQKLTSSGGDSRRTTGFG
jgi:hypothetical protein